MMTPEDLCRRSPVGGPHTWLRSVSRGGRAHGAAVPRTRWPTWATRNRHGRGAVTANRRTNPATCSRPSDDRACNARRLARPE